MAASIEGLRDRWERMAPRERRLVMALGVTAVVCVFAWVGLTIRDGLRAIETKNAETRDALAAIERHRASAAEPADEGPQVVIGDTAIALPSYLEEAAREVGFTIPGFTPRQPVAKGKFNEVTVAITLKGVTIDELRQFLEKVETKQRIVVVTAMKVSRQFRDNEKLDVDMTVATYEKAKAKKTEEGAAAASPAEEG